MEVTERLLSSCRRLYAVDELAYEQLHIPEGDFCWVEKHFDHLLTPWAPQMQEVACVNIAVVFSFLARVPILPLDRTWLALQHQVGGHACMHRYLIATELRVHPDLYDGLRAIARRRWGSWHGGRTGAAETNEAAVATYRSELADLGLTYSGEWITQAIYPIDASQSNLDRLSDRPVTLAELGVDGDAMAKRLGAG